MFLIYICAPNRATGGGPRKPRGGRRLPFQNHALACCVPASGTGTAGTADVYSWGPLGPPLGGVLLGALRAVLRPFRGSHGTPSCQLGATLRPQEPISSSSSSSPSSSSSFSSSPLLPSDGAVGSVRPVWLSSNEAGALPASFDDVSRHDKSFASECYLFTFGRTRKRQLVQ